MNRKAIEHIINGNFRKIKKQLSGIDHDPDTENIHEYRLQVKKLRAFLRLLSCQLNLADKPVLPGNLKRIYDATGKLRNLQLQQARILQMTEGPLLPFEYHQFIQKKISKNRDIVQSLAREYLPGKQKKSVIRNIPVKARIHSIARFLDQKKDGIFTLLKKGTMTTPDLHSIRKMLKDCIFIMKLAIKAGLESPFYWNKAEMEKAVSTEQLLGAYNDVCIALNLLNYKKGRDNKLEQPALFTPIVDKLEKERLSLEEYFHTIDFQTAIKFLFPG